MNKLLAILESAIIPTGILLGSVLCASLFRTFFNRLIKRQTSHLNNDPTNYKFLKHSITALIYLVGLCWAIYTVPTLRVMATSMLAGAGILAVVVGFASQQALSNIVAGVFIVIFKPFRVNERVILKEGVYVGVVEDITLRHTVIRDFENKRIIIPNSAISSEIIVNPDYTEDKVCKWIEVGVAYNSDIEKAKKLMQEEIQNHPNCLDNRTNEEKAEKQPVVRVRLIKMLDSAVILRAWAWSPDSAKGFELLCDSQEAILKRFNTEGISIPFPQRTIHYADSQNKDAAR